MQAHLELTGITVGWMDDLYAGKHDYSVLFIILVVGVVLLLGGLACFLFWWAS